MSFPIGHQRYPYKAEAQKALLLIAKGEKDEDVSVAVGMTQRWVQKIKGSEWFSKKLEAIHQKQQNMVAVSQANKQIREKARDTIDKAAQKAALTMVRIASNKRIKGPDGYASLQEKKLMYDAARDILDRAGLKAVEVIETRERHYSPEEIQKAHSTLMELEQVIKRLSSDHSTYLLNPDKITEANLVHKGT